MRNRKRNAKKFNARLLFLKYKKHFYILIYEYYLLFYYCKYNTEITSGKIT